MLFRTYVPRPPLAAFVELFWHYDEYAQQHTKERVLPSGDVLRTYDTRDPRRSQTAPNTRTTFACRIEFTFVQYSSCSSRQIQEANRLPATRGLHYSQIGSSSPRKRKMIQRALYVLAVCDLEKSAAFYRDVLGFEVREIGDSGWRMFVRDGCRIMAGECRDALPARELGDHSYFAYFVVDDVDAYHAAVIAQGAELIKPLRNEPWGLREFGLRTVDGH